MSDPVLTDPAPAGPTPPGPRPPAEVPASIGAAAPTPAWSGRSTARSGLHGTVLIAVLAAVFGFAYWAVVQLWATLQIAMGPLGDLAQNVLAGAWIVVTPLAIHILRRPGVGILAELLAALVEIAFLASPSGPLLLVTALVQGVGAELAFTLTGYRRYGWWVFVLSGVGACLTTFTYNMLRFGWIGQDHLALRFAFTLASCVLLCGIAARLLGDALARTGVLDNHPLGRARR